MKNTVTQKDIDTLYYSGQLDVKTVHGKTTVVSLKLPNGFTIVESSSCVDQANYDEEMGTQICVERIKNKLWELEGYVLQKELHAAKRNPAKETAEQFFNGEHFDEITGTNPLMLDNGGITAGTISAGQIITGIAATPSFPSPEEFYAKIGKNPKVSFNAESLKMVNLETPTIKFDGQVEKSEPVGDEYPTPAHNESIYMLTEVLRALDETDHAFREAIKEKIAKVLNL